LSDSDYNAQDLALAGLNGSPSVVIPPFHQVDRLQSVTPDPEVLARFGQQGFTNVLMVGRVVPNKRHELLIEAFAEYHRRSNPASRLLIVGGRDPRLKTYNDHLDALVERLGLREAVHFLGSISD